MSIRVGSDRVDAVFRVWSISPVLVSRGLVVWSYEPGRSLMAISGAS